MAGKQTGVKVRWLSSAGKLYGAGLTKTHHRKTAFGIAAFHTGLQKGKGEENIFLNTAQEKLTRWLDKPGFMLN